VRKRIDFTSLGRILEQTFDLVDPRHEQGR
jgi:hypothetical protein